MNINDLNPIKTVNIESAMNTAYGTGTFKEILDKVYADEIRPLVMNSGEIVGISYDAKTSNHIDDNLEQMKFERRYAGKPVMEYVLKALECKAKNIKVRDIIENEDSVKVIAENGEEIVVVDNGYNYDYDEDNYYGEELPDEVEIPYDELGIENEDDLDEEEVKKWLRENYDHYLARGCELDIEADDYDEYVVVSNIEWGRKR